MAIKLTNTRESLLKNGLKILVHGPAGSGKTRLTATIDEPAVIISCEGGLLSLGDVNIPVIEINEWKDLDEAYDMLVGEAGAGFKWIVLDSFSDIAEVCLAKEKAKAPDPRQAYGGTQDKVFAALRKWRDLPGKHVYFIAKQKREKDETTGATLLVPSMPGNALSQGVSYFFDEVFALRLVDDGKGGVDRVLQTARDLQYDCKDRSSKLAKFEPADLTIVKNKILAGVADLAAAEAAA